MSNYVKARYEGNKRSYCFAAEEDLKPGDEAVTPNGTKVTVVDEPVDLSWIEAYGSFNALSGLSCYYWKDQQIQVTIEFQCPPGLIPHFYGTPSKT